MVFTIKFAVRLDHFSQIENKESLLIKTLRNGQTYLVMPIKARYNDRFFFYFLLTICQLLFVHHFCKVFADDTQGINRNHQGR